jgi:hypothetical protein
LSFIFTKKISIFRQYFSFFHYFLTILNILITFITCQLSPFCLTSQSS